MFYWHINTIYICISHSKVIGNVFTIIWNIRSLWNKIILSSIIIYRTVPFIQFQFFLTEMIWKKKLILIFIFFNVHSHPIWCTSMAEIMYSCLYYSSRQIYTSVDLSHAICLLFFPSFWSYGRQRSVINAFLIELQAWYSVQRWAVFPSLTVVFLSLSAIGPYCHHEFTNSDFAIGPEHLTLYHFSWVMTPSLRSFIYRVISCYNTI